MGLKALKIVEEVFEQRGSFINPFLADTERDEIDNVLDKLLPLITKRIKAECIEQGEPDFDIEKDDEDRRLVKEYEPGDGVDGSDIPF